MICAKVSGGAPSAGGQFRTRSSRPGNLPPNTRNDSKAPPATAQHRADAFNDGQSMPNESRAPTTIDQYIRAAPDRVRPILERIRRTVRDAVPEATEVVSYRMPAFKLHGILIYFAAFKNHIGVFPPVRGDPKLVKAAAPYAGEKGNLRFPLDKPIPYDLIRRIVVHRAKQNLAKRTAKAKKRRGAAAQKPPIQPVRP